MTSIEELKFVQSELSIIVSVLIRSKLEQAK